MFLKKLSYLVFFAVFSLIISRTSFAYPASQEDLFSYDRFYKSTGMVKAMAGEKETAGEIRYFAEYFLSGMDALSRSDDARARENFSKALRAWPEYFWTDLLLALICEDAGDERAAARFFKSYLKKLGEYHKGKYRISGTLIRVLGGGKVESYDEAYARVKERLAEEGIDIDKVRTLPDLPMAVYFVGAVILAAAGYVAVSYKVVPVIRRWYRVTFPPTGFWGCRYCGGISPNLSRICHNCQRPRG